jgi:hypothetical protein
MKINTDEDNVQFWRTAYSNLKLESEETKLKEYKLFKEVLAHRDKEIIELKNRINELEGAE